MKYRPLIAFLFALVLVSGCHKKAAPAATEQQAGAQAASAEAITPATDASGSPAAAGTQPVPATPITPLPPPPKYVTASADNTVRQRIEGEPDAMMTGLLRSFVQKNGRMPQSFYEFSLKGMDSIPRPPEGKHWVIDAADMQVKAVPAR